MKEDAIATQDEIKSLKKAQNGNAFEIENLERRIKNLECEHESLKSQCEYIQENNPKNSGDIDELTGKGIPILG